MKTAQEMVERLHYAGGGSNTATDVHGLYRKGTDVCRGVAWWLPPTRVCAESVCEDWQRVVSLTRLVLESEVPTNGASFLLSRSIKRLKNDGRWVALVTYADESQGHLGNIYRATNWIYAGKTGPYPRWVDQDGRQRAAKATKNRRKAEMEALGYKMVGRFYKHKFIYLLQTRRYEEEDVPELEAAK